MLGAESLEKRLKSSDADEDAGTGGSVDVADVVSSGAGSVGLGKADADKAGAAVASLVVPTEQQKGNFPTAVMTSSTTTTTSTLASRTSVTMRT